MGGGRPPKIPNPEFEKEAIIVEDGRLDDELTDRIPQFRINQTAQDKAIRESSASPMPLSIRIVEKKA